MGACFISLKVEISDSIVEAKCTGGKTRGYVYLGATPVGTFSLSDSCRSGAPEAIKDLKSLGIKIKSVILTGDSHAAALYAQDQVCMANNHVIIYTI